MPKTRSNYDKDPFINVTGSENEAWVHWSAIGEQIKTKLGGRTKNVVAIECYPGVRESDIVSGLAPILSPCKVIRSIDAALPGEELEALVGRYLTDDRVFGYIAPFRAEELFDQKRLEQLQAEMVRVDEGTILVIGVGASIITDADVLVYADLSRWEIQQRYRSKEIGNWNVSNHDEDILRKYKRGYFFEWRVADQLKRSLLERVDFYLDTHIRDVPKMIRGTALLSALAQTARRPFRLVPYFDPGVWGGNWLIEHIDLPPKEHPYAWGFDGVPEENSIYFQFGEIRIEVPAINLVFYQPKELLGERVYARFGAEFPIRFDFLDTIGGQNLSLQVHPSTDYIQQTFGMHYTQDESYYILDAEPGSVVYLGLQTGVDKERVAADLFQAQEGDFSFPANQYINRFPAHKHDHFLIPAGTIHCSGRGCLVLEISATPYIFTFKLWDWDRLGLDGKPRPVHLDHGLRNIRWERTTEWVNKELVNRIERLSETDSHIEERTGLHYLQFIETRRNWFSEPVKHYANGSVQMLNLVEGLEATVESPSGMFEPFVVHYAETFIIPASIDSYTIRPSGPSIGNRIATIKAYVR